MKIIIVDDNNEFREHTEFFITHKLKHQVVGSFSSGIEFVKRYAEYNPDIVLMDISMPDLDGYEVTKMLNWQDENLKIIAVTMFTDLAYLHKLIEVGFKGCVFKSSIFNELADAIDVVEKGHYYWPESMSEV